MQSPSVCWAYEGIAAFVALADLQPGESVLELGHGGGAQVAMVAKEVLKDKYGPIIVVDALSQSLLEARSWLKCLDWTDKIILESGDLTSLEAIPSLCALEGQFHNTFDVIFAKDVLRHIPERLRVPALRHWTKYLTPYTGRMIITYHLGVEACLDTAGIVAINHHDGKTLRRWCLMLDSGWEAGKEALNSLATEAGLFLRTTHRVDFDGEGAAQWEDTTELSSNDHVAFTHAETLERGIPDPQSTDEAFEPEFVKSISLVPHKAVIAGVVVHSH